MQELISANFTKFSAVRETLFREKFRILSNHEILTKDLYIYIYIYIYFFFFLGGKKQRRNENKGMKSLSTLLHRKQEYMYIFLNLGS